MKKLEEAPLGYWEEKSYMMAITKDENSDYFKDSIERIKTVEGVEILDQHFNAEQQVIHIKLKYQNEEYEVGCYPGNVNVPSYYVENSTLFTEKEKQELLNAKRALTIFMEFHEDSKTSFHLQLKLALAMVPDLIGVLDESAEKVLPARWVRMTAMSDTLPSSKSLFTIQAVMGNKNKVWLHTHGLCRCGLTELEILESDVKNYQNHYNLISTYAMYLLDKNDTRDPSTTSAFIGCLINGYPVVVTCRSWVDGLKEYKKLQLGNEKERKNGHNSKTSIIFLYQSEEDEKNGVLSKVSIYDDLWGENPLFFFSDEETARMKEVAMERFSYVKEAFQNQNHVLIKIGLPLKEEGKFEHIWFELLEIKGEQFRAKLTQEPYEELGIHEGDEKWFTVDDVTSWMIYTDRLSIDPDLVYLLDDEK